MAPIPSAPIFHPFSHPCSHPLSYPFSHSNSHFLLFPTAWLNFLLYGNSYSWNINSPQGEGELQLLNNLESREVVQA